MSSENIAGKSEPVDSAATQTPQQSKQEEEQSAGTAGNTQDKRVQWSKGDPIPSDAEGAVDEDADEETKRQQIEDLKR